MSKMSVEEAVEVLQRNRKLSASARAGLVLADALEASKRRVRVLEGIVDRLPKTADGVPITHGCVTYCNDRNPFPHEWAIRLRSGETFEQHCKRDNETHYSTREAALAAQPREHTDVC
jgi:hypothetical protein